MLFVDEKALQLKKKKRTYLKLPPLNYSASLSVSSIHAENKTDQKSFLGAN